jgi:hypothetical protein
MTEISEIKERLSSALWPVGLTPAFYRQKNGAVIWGGTLKPPWPPIPES